MSHSYHSRTTSQTKERSSNVQQTRKALLKTRYIYRGADCSETIERTETETNLPLNPITIAIKTSLSSFLLNFSREIACNLKNGKPALTSDDITWRAIQISRNKWKRKGAMIKPRDADEKGREWWRHAGGREGGKAENSSCRSHVTYHWLNPFNFSFPLRIVRGIDNTVPLFVYAKIW